MTKKSQIFRVTFYNQGSIYEIYAKHVGQSDLYGFVEIGEIIFGNNSMVVDPAEERLKAEFSGVNTTYIPIQSVLRIDEVEKQGIAKMRDVSQKGSNNVTNFPIPLYSPQGPEVSS